MKLRPYLYHLTAESNISSIKATRELQSASTVLEGLDRERLLRTKRSSSLRLALNGHSFSLRDQEPLHAGNMDLQQGWTFGDVIEMLNRHVFFWPGNASGPIDYGVRHFSRYEDIGERLVVLRVPTLDLVTANHSCPPKFCRYNSGSPRCSGGKKSPRGEDTFQPGSSVSGAPSKVVEVVFGGKVWLPGSAGYGILHGDRWQCVE